MVEWLLDNPWAIWLGIAVFLAALEMFSLDFVLSGFGIGAALAALASGLGAPVWLCIGIFGAVSAAMLLLVRPPLVARMHDGPTLKQGPENFVGTTGVALSDVDFRDGRIRLSGDVWSARTESPSTAIGTGADVLIVRIEGATAIVAPDPTSIESTPTEA